MKYSISIHLDRILKHNKKGYSQTRLIEDSGLSHKYIVNLINHEHPGLDKLATVLNTLNDPKFGGLDLKPSDLISIDPIGKARVSVEGIQYNDDNSLTCLINVGYNKNSSFELIDLAFKHSKKTITFKLTAFDHKITPQLFRIIMSKGEFSLSEGLFLLGDMPIDQKASIAQTISLAAVSYLLETRHINTGDDEANCKISFKWFTEYLIDLKDLDIMSRPIHFQNKKDFGYRELVDHPENIKYPFLRPNQIGLIGGSDNKDKDTH